MDPSPDPLRMSRKIILLSPFPDVPGLPPLSNICSWLASHSHCFVTLSLMYSNTSERPSPVFAEVKNSAGPIGGFGVAENCFCVDVSAPFAFVFDTSVPEFNRDGVTVCTDSPELDEASRRRPEDPGDPTGTSRDEPLVLGGKPAKLAPPVVSAVGVVGLVPLYPESNATSPSPTTPSELEAIACSTSGSQNVFMFPSRILPDGVGGPESIRDEEAVW